MKAVGFIDYYLDEWHANNYPDWINNQSNGEYQVKYAYAAIESPNADALTNAQWAEKYSVTLVDSIDKLIELSDCIIVLSPDDPQMHYELSNKALQSGKPTYIDKTFSLKGDEAKSIFDIGEKYNSACFSSSALRFSEKLQQTNRENINSVISIGCGEPTNYLIHQLEPIAVLMGTDAKEVMFVGNNNLPAWIIKYDDNKTAEVHFMKSWCDYTLHINYSDSNQTLVINDDFFKGLIDSIINMFNTNQIPVEHTQTVGIIKILETCLKAQNKPFEWVNID